ncbi:MAG: glycosyltransferase family 4 protein [Bacteroidetes bacterium]|nr:glycosyltransferase family 4 protein [Bacteroidota bacterium]MBS1740072.1 glycosyltransferase family 4 protein [Bacteroidota bacterium]
MTIVMLCDAYFEGFQYQENLLSRYFSRKGHSVVALAGNFKNVFDYMNDVYLPIKQPIEIFADGARIIKLPLQYNRFKKIRKFKGVYSLLKQLKPDLIYVHQILPDLSEAVRFKKQNPQSRIVVDYHSDYSNSARSKLSLLVLHKIFRANIYKRAARYIDKIYPVTPSSATFLHEVYGISYKKMKLLPLGVDLKMCKEVKENHAGEEIRRQLNIPSEARVIFNGGKLTQLKKSKLLVEAVNFLQDKNVHLLLVGQFTKDDPYEEEVRIAAKGNPNIHFIGWVNSTEVYNYMGASDIAVFPASQTVLWQQSLGMGLPLILGEAYINEAGNEFCHDVDYLNIDDNIRIIRKGQMTIESLAEKIHKLLYDPNLTLIKHRAYQVAEKMLDYDKIVDEILN